MVDILSKLATYTSLNYSSIEDATFDHGKLGISTALLLSATALDDLVLKKHAERFWDSVVNDAISKSKNRKIEVDIIRSIYVLQRLGVIEDTMGFVAEKWGIDYLKNYQYNPNFINENNYDKIISLMLVLFEKLPNKICSDVFNLITKYILRTLQKVGSDYPSLMDNCERYFLLCYLLNKTAEYEKVIRSLVDLYNANIINFPITMLYIIKHVHLVDGRGDLFIGNLLNLNYLDFISLYCFDLDILSKLLFFCYCFGEDNDRLIKRNLTLSKINKMLPLELNSRFCYKNGISKFLTLLSITIILGREKISVAPISLYL